MSGDFIIFILLCALAALLVTAIITDIRSRIISNRLNLAVALLAPLFWLASGFSLWPDMVLQLALAAGVFALFATLFYLGQMHGGDVKLLTALALWFPWKALLVMLVLMSLAGGVVTAVTLFHHWRRKREGAPEVPYGVAISVAALWLVSERIIYQFG